MRASHTSHHAPPGARLLGYCSARRAARVQQVARAQQVAGQGKLYIDPVEREAAAFAPATVANLGPGFDWMGCAVEVRGAWGGWGCLWKSLLAWEHEGQQGSTGRGACCQGRKAAGASPATQRRSLRLCKTPLPNIHCMAAGRGRCGRGTGAARPPGGGGDRGD